MRAAPRAAGGLDRETSPRSDPVGGPRVLRGCRLLHQLGRLDAARPGAVASDAPQALAGVPHCLTARTATTSGKYGSWLSSSRRESSSAARPARNAIPARTLPD